MLELKHQAREDHAEAEPARRRAHGHEQRDAEAHQKHVPDRADDAKVHGAGQPPAGGEILEPRLAILDETDSGLDIDALRVVAAGINAVRAPDRAQLLITHYQRILDYVTPQFVHVLMNGRIVKSGGAELAKELEKRGYEWVEKEAA